MLSDWIKFYINKIFSSKYRKTGKCKQCGQCCRSIVFTDNNQPINDIEKFRELQMKYKFYRHFDVNGYDSQGNLLFKCKSLDSKNRCKDYFFRSLYCRKYPDIDKKFIMAGGVLLDNCGYKIVPDKKFIDYLN